MDEPANNLTKILVDESPADIIPEKTEDELIEEEFKPIPKV